MSMPDLPAFPPTQPYFLSPAETLFWDAEQSVRGGVRSAGLFRLEGRIDSNLMAAALQQLQQRHPKLRAVIVRESDGRLRYDVGRPVQQIPFELKDCDEGEVPFREEARRMLLSEFPVGAPLLMVTVLRNAARNSSYLILVVHHAIADGVSTIRLGSDLLAGYARAEAGKAEAPGPSLPLARGARAKTSGSWRQRLWLIRRFMRIQREEKHARLISLPQASEVLPHSQWVLWAFSPDETARLVRRCRDEQTSLVGVMTAAACCGLMDCLPLERAVIKCQFPFDIRNKLEGSITTQDVGSFASIMNEFYHVSRPSSFWEMARRVHTDMQMFMQNDGPSFYYNILPHIRKVAGWLSSSVPPKPSRPANDQRVTLYATNYGVTNFRDAYGSLRVREGTIFFGGDIVAQWLVLSSLVIGQRLSLGFAADCIEPALWEQLRVAVRKYLDMVIRPAEAPRAAH